MNKRFSPPNPGAQGPARWAAICRKMVETDSTIAAAWEATSSTLLSGRCYAEPGDETNSLSVKMADLLNQSLGLVGHRGRMKRSFESCLSDMLKYLLNGFRYGEIEWDIDNEGVAYITDAWLDRDPAGHDRWDIDPGTNHLLGVWQRIPSGDLGRDDHCSYIPGNELVYLGRHARGSDYNGTGMLRPCYFPWKAKEDLIRSHSEALNRSLNPTLNVRVNRIAARIDAEKEGLDWEKVDADLCDRVEAIGKVADNRAIVDYIVESTPYISVGELAAKKPNPEIHNEMIAEKDKEILVAFLLQFTIDVVPTHASLLTFGTPACLWLRSLNNTLDYVLSQWGRVAIPKWVELNFGNVHRNLLPVMKHSGFDANITLEQLARLHEKVRNLHL